ncbi:MAG: hypothetical protein AB7U38_04450 [Hyphomicrobiales bacterium]
MSLMTHLRRRTNTDAPPPAQARHSAFIDSYLRGLPEAGIDADTRLVTVIARSPESAHVQALMQKASELETAGVSVRAIFADLEAISALRDFCDTASRLTGGQDPATLVRWANRDCLSDAHEQVTLGTRMCWSGDAIRRRADVRDGLNLFEQNAPSTVRLGAMAFVAIWDISERISASRLRPQGRGKPCGTFQDADGGRIAAYSFLEKANGVGILRH